VTCGNCCDNRDMQAKLIAVGSETACILPREILEPLHAKEGDTLLVTETNDGIMLSPADEEFRRQMALAEDVMHRYRNTLRELSK
jgi:putative addiction module antidote